MAAVGRAIYQVNLFSTSDTYNFYFHAIPHIRYYQIIIDIASKSFVEIENIGLLLLYKCLELYMPIQ